MTLQQSVQHLLQNIGPGYMSGNPYDTAWAARLVPYAPDLAYPALDWLRENQLADGSWGAAQPAYYHDRLVCTLAALVALAENADPQDAERIERGRQSLHTVVRPLAKGVLVETIAAELLIPMLFTEAERLGVVQRWDDPELQRLERQRQLKMSVLPKGLINRLVTLNFSAEMVGRDGTHLLDLSNLREANGSVGTSPSATAYYARIVAPGDPDALAYLRKAAKPDGSLPNVAPFDIFETSWVLYNLYISGALDETNRALAAPHVKFLLENWDAQRGVAFASGYAPLDGDDTNLAYIVLTLSGQSLDVQTILNFEADDHFWCFQLEANPSVSCNIHALSALRHAGFPGQHPAVRKIVRFLHSFQYWFDKWHVSPYYPTSHAIITGAGYVDDLLHDAVRWMLDTQQADGSWGYFVPTAEETAYCLQALVTWARNGYSVPAGALQRGANWLAQHTEPPYPPLWIGKCLYTPIYVVQSAIVGARLMVEQTVGIN